MIVCKFGGTSVACNIENIKQILKNQNRRVIVFSAFGKKYSKDVKVTDLLIDICRRKITNQSYQVQLLKVKNRFNEIINEYNIKININKLFKKIIKKYQKTGDCDYLISRGEYLTTYILSKYLKIKFIPCEKVLFFNDYKPNYKKINKKLLNLLKKYKQIAVPGFYGINNKKVFIFDRGGSDYSGAVIANSLKTPLYENWTDVDGVYPVNPKFFKTKAIDVMSFDELLTMSMFDANVVASSCVKELQKGNCVLKIKNTNNLNAKGTIALKYKSYNVNFFSYLKNDNRFLICFPCKNYIIKRLIAKNNGVAIKDKNLCYYLCGKIEFNNLTKQLKLISENKNSLF